MTINKSTTILWTIIAFTLISGLLWVDAAIPVAQAGPELPSRSTPTPVSDKDHDRSEPVGAHIELTAAGISAGAWAVVQWQDSNGDWHTVEGWQGTMSSSSQRWWVHPKDFGSGPFRWAVQTAAGGPATAVSEPFYLPAFPNETLQVPVK